jgi:aquaporin Z
MSPPQEVPKSGAIARYERDVHERIENFNDPRQEWRRLFSELLGTFFLVLDAAGAGMMNTAFPGSISRSAVVIAPALIVMAIILFMGKVSGAHLNPAVSIAFALRGDFPWRRVPGYIAVQAVAIAYVLRGSGGDRNAVAAAKGTLVFDVETTRSS